MRLVKGDYDAVTEYSDDPVAVAARFVAEGAEMVHVVDLEAARGGGRSQEIVEALGEAGVPFQVGGGIRTPASATAALSAGATRVVVGSAILGTLPDAKRIIEAVGVETVVAAIDVRAGRARGSAWLDEGLRVSDAVERLGVLGVERALVTGIESDGTMTGPALELFSEVRELEPHLELIASGGVGTLADIRSLAASAVNFEGVIVGRALYENRFTLPAALEAGSAARSRAGSVGQ